MKGMLDNMDNKLKILIEYNYRKKQYYIFSNNNKIYFANSDNNKIKFEMSEEEKRVAIKVYSAFLVNVDKSIKVDRVKIEDREYDIFYDKDSGNYFWKNIKNDTDDNEEDNIILNIRYNHQDPIIYSGNDKMSSIKEKIYTKILNIGTIILVVIASASINPVTIARDFEMPTVYSEVTSNEIQDESERPTCDLERLENAIKHNSNLQDEEKEFTLNVVNLLFEFHHEKYIDGNLVAKRLRDFVIEYKDNIFYKLEGGTINGRWNLVDKKIQLFVDEYWKEMHQGDEHNFENTDKSVLTHEESHMFQADNTSILHEQSNEYLTRSIVEILSDRGLINLNNSASSHDERRSFGKGYNNTISIYYIITKFMTKEQIIEFQYTGNENIIVQALSKYATEEEVYSLLTKIKTTNFNHDNYEKGQVYRDLNNLYKRMTGKNIYEDLNIQAIMSFKDIHTAFISIEYYRRQKAFIRLLREELIKQGKINRTDIVYISCERNDFYYPNDLFFGDYRKNMIIYPIVEIKESDRYSIRNCAIELTDEMQQEFDKMYQEICSEKFVEFRIKNEENR